MTTLLVATHSFTAGAVRKLTPQTMTLKKVDVHNGHKINALAFMEDSRVVTGASDGSVMVSSPFNGLILAALIAENRYHAGDEKPCPMTSIACSSDGVTIAAGTENGKVNLWEVEAGGSGRQINTLTVNKKSGRVAVAFSRNGEFLAAATPSKVAVFVARSGEPVQHLGIQEGSLSPSIAFSPDDKSMVFGNGDLYFIQFPSFKVSPIRRDNDNHFSGAIVSPTGETMAAAAGRGVQIGLWSFGRIQDSANTNVWHQTGHEHYFTDTRLEGIAYSPDGKLMASATSREVLVWGIPHYEPTRTLKDHQAPITAVAFSPDGHYFASADWKGIVNIYS